MFMCPTLRTLHSSPESLLHESSLRASGGRENPKAWIFRSASPKYRGESCLPKQATAPAAFYAAKAVGSQRHSPLLRGDNACSWTTLTPWPLIATSYVAPPG